MVLYQGLAKGIENNVTVRKNAEEIGSNKGTVVTKQNKLNG